MRRMPPLVPTSASTTEHLARPPDLRGAWCTRQIHHATKTNTIYNRDNNNLNTNTIGREMNISKMASFRIDLEAEKRPKDISSLPSVAQKSCNCPPIFAPAFTPKLLGSYTTKQVPDNSGGFSRYLRLTEMENLFVATLTVLVCFPTWKRSKIHEATPAFVKAVHGEIRISVVSPTIVTVY